jgi:NAD(P)-dependent dehydrogenase (short-subunit alcohol dehydrogenase family)
MKKKPLTGRVALVAGATRGTGRGIARALGEAGAVVYCTGRSVRGHPSPYKRPETIDETADVINAAGGTAVAVRVDHTVEAEVEALFGRIDREHGRLDVLVNSIAGDEPMMAQWNSFWKTELKDGEAIFRQALLSHIITAKHAAPLMIRARRGLIVEVTENDVLMAGGNPLSQSVKLALKGLAFNMAAELKPHGVAAVAITPGFLGSEAMLDRFGVTEANWRDAGTKDVNFLEAPAVPPGPVARRCGDSGRVAEGGVEADEAISETAAASPRQEENVLISSSTSASPDGHATPSTDAPASSSACTDSGVRRPIQYESTQARTASISGVRPLPSRTSIDDPRSISSRTVAWLARQAAT